MDDTDIVETLLNRMNNRALEEFANMDSFIKDNLKSFKCFQEMMTNKMLEYESNIIERISPNKRYNEIRSSKRLPETSSSDDEPDVSSARVKLHNVPENTEKFSSKPKRGAAVVANKNIAKTSNMKLNSKMRRPTTQEFTPADIKIEKRSESMLLEESVNKKSCLPDITNEMNMPPPTAKPKRGRKKVKEEVHNTNNVESKGTTRITRSTRTKKRDQSTESKNTHSTENASPSRKDSDVLIQEIPVAIIVLTDSESEVEKSVDSTKQIKNVQKTAESDNIEVKSKQYKKQKKQVENKMKLKIKKEKLTEEEIKNNTQNSTNNEMQISIYEDALSENKTLDNNTNQNDATSGQQINNAEIATSSSEAIISCKLKSIDINSALNVTHDITKNTLISNIDTLSPAVMNIMKENNVKNCTVVLNKKISNENVNNELNLNVTKILTDKEIEHNKINILPSNSNLLTDDDDSFVVCAPTKVPIKKKSVKTKPIFSPYGSSPVKKRVAAFEKLGTADVPARVTRTKTRNLAAAEKDQTNYVEETPSNRRIPPTTAKSKKHLTQLPHSKIPSLTTSVDRQNKLNKNASVVSEASTKPSTAVKASRAELQERREEERKRKLEYENEVKRKKDALLQAKAEEQRRKREEKQMKAQQVREAKEREKEEKIRRIIQEKEEKLQKEEQLKKEGLALAKKAAEDEKYQQMLKQKKIEEERRLNKKLPPLPTDDLEDSDDEENTAKQKYVGPLWSQAKYLNPVLKCQQYIPSATIKKFFLMEAQTPDLSEIFENINPDILRRNSSAVWRTPPRYSTLPRF